MFFGPFLCQHNLGTDGGTKTDDFSEKFQGGGIFNPKTYIADFGLIQGFKEGFSGKKICNIIFRK